MEQVRRFGWLPQPPDQRDFKFAATGKTLASLPSKVDLRTPLMQVFDQGDLGSCVANAVSGALRFNQIKAGGPDFTPSRLFIYYTAREFQGWTDWDSGAYIRDGVKGVAQKGAPAEGRNTSGSWEYDIRHFTEKPSPAAYNHAANHQALNYYAVGQSNSQLKGALAEGHPIVFGFTVYDSFYNVGSDGLVPMPGYYEDVLGGHAVLILGYDDASRRYIVQNSWGTYWGDHGFMYMPYEYVESPSLSDDFWVIREQELGFGR